MRTLHAGYRGLSTLMLLNWDRFLYTGMLTIALVIGAWLGTL